MMKVIIKLRGEQIAFLFVLHLSPVRNSDKEDVTLMEVLSRCVECRIEDARYWGSNLCEKCFREILIEKMEEEK